MKTLPDSQNALLEKTKRFDLIRACCTEPVGATFGGSGLGVIVALQFFNAQDWQKALLASGATIGLMFGPLVVMLIARWGIRVNRAASTLFMAAAPGFCLAAFAPTLNVFMLGVLAGIPLLTAAAPLITAIWEQNAPSAARGRVFSHVVLVSAAVALCASLLISFIIRDDIERFRPIFILMSLLCLGAAAAAWRIPTQPVPRSRHHAFPLSSMRLMWENRMFGYLCMGQMLLGIGNLATIPLRVEYLASTSRGMSLPAGLVLILTVAVPEAGRLLSTRLWGRLFDRMHFVILRLTINLIFAASVVLFFIPHMAGIITGSLLFGIATGGGKIAWSLWVTRYAPPDKTADYMGVHTFLTGVRGIIAPQAAYAALAVLTVQQVGWIGTALILAATAMLLFVLPTKGDREQAGSG